MRRAILGAGVAASLMAAAAWAQGDVPPPPPDAPVQQQPGVGGSATVGVYPQQTVVQTQQAPGSVLQQHPFTLAVMGGVEGYSGPLAGEINPGATYGLALGVEPLQFLGFELGYSGGVANLHNTSGVGGPDLIRNGGYLIATPGLTAWLDGSGSASIKPYLLGGVGLDGYTAQNNAPGQGFTNQVDGNVPFGAGIELRAAQFVANARFNYNWEFGNQFQPFTNSPFRYQGQLALGGAF